MAAVTRPRDNRDRLVVAAAAARVAPAAVFPEALRSDRDGRAFVLPGTGGVHPDVHVGDPAAAFAADHLMVGASVVDASASTAEPGAVHLLACVGNRVRLADGTHLGVVAGKRGGLAPGYLPPSLLSVEAPTERLEALAPGAGVVIETVGRGLALPDWPDVLLSNLDPSLLDALGLREADGRLEFGVRAVVPSRAAGAGLGQDAWIGDIEIADATAIAPAGVELRFGDLVAFEAIDGRYGRFHRPGTVSVGLVAHGSSPAPGHGIGVTILVAGSAERLAVVVDDGASLAGALRERALSGSRSRPAPGR